MMTGIDPENDPGRAGAARLLRVDEQASPVEVRQAMLARLREAELVPPQSWIEAFRLLAGKSMPASPWHEIGGLPGQEKALREEVESFAQAFWSLAVEERRQRWQRLIEVCKNFPALIVRLRQLQSGLEIEPPALDSCPPRVQQLGQKLLDLFVLRPAQRAIERQKLLAEWQPERWDWQAAAQQLRQMQPAIATLDALFVAHIASWSPREVKLRRARRAWSRAQAHRDGVPGGRRKTIASWAWIIIMASFVIRLIIAGTGESPRRHQDPLRIDSASFRQEMSEQFKRYQEESKKHPEWKNESPEEATRRILGLPGPKPVSPRLPPNHSTSPSKKP